MGILFEVYASLILLLYSDTGLIVSSLERPLGRSSTGNLNSENSYYLLNIF